VSPARALLALLTVCLSTLVTLGAIEIALRLARGSLGGAPDPAAGPLRMIGERYPGSYHSRLGFVPTPGFSSRQNVWDKQVTITADGVRSNGGPPPSGTPVLAVGDSFTFGDEVDDDATWPAQLERALGRPVVNGGVFGYGFDQIVLRAEQLLERIPADTLVVSLIAGDVERCEYSYRYAWKPYFDIEDGALVLRNVPVPEPHEGPPSEPAILRVLRHSFLADFVLRRVDPEAWLLPGSIRAHSQGPEVSVLLVDRLTEAARERRLRLLLVVQWHPGASRRPLLPMLARAREREVEVLDLEPILRARIESGRASVRGLFHVYGLPGGGRLPGHMNRRGNAWVAERVASRLRQPPGPPPDPPGAV